MICDTMKMLPELTTNFNTIVLQTVLSVDELCGEERFVFNSISYRKKEEEEGGGGVGTLSTYLSINPSLEGGLTY